LGIGALVIVVDSFFRFEIELFENIAKTNNTTEVNINFLIKIIIYKLSKKTGRCVYARVAEVLASSLI